MSSVLFFAMVIALVSGIACFGFASACGLREGRRRIAFFAGSMIGFWGGCVGLLADDISAVFSTVEAGMEESVRNAVLDHWHPQGDTVAVRHASHLCSSEDLKSGKTPDCLLAIGVNSTEVCRQWMLYVPFLLPYARPCPALRTSPAVLADADARAVLTAAINAPCDYLSKGDDFTTRRMRKALGCGPQFHDGKVVLIVDQPGDVRTLVLRQGDIHFP
ncbi:MAG: hypothetical protein F8N37_03830 [Telmatospirillum sp.]|nr:hypothetical protein [Telmatospirillum sp.]